MKRGITVFCLAAAVVCAAPAVSAQYLPGPGEAPNPAGGLNKAQLEAIAGSLALTPSLKAASNALARTKMADVAVDRETALAGDELFTHVIKDPGAITNQQRTGRCWLFAGLNILRPPVIAKNKLKNFELSQAYDQFWDKLERANRTLELAIALRDQPLDGRKNSILLKKPIQDGGDWNFVVALVAKYGVVPKALMPDTYAASHTGEMNALLAARVRKGIMAIRKAGQKGAGAARLRAIKVDTLKDVYKVLVLCLGQPPRTFPWRYRDKEGKVSEFKTYTPQSFYRDFVGGGLEDYVAFVNYPGKPMHAKLEWAWNRDMADTPNMTAANVTSAELSSMAMASVLADEAVWFACNSSVQRDRKNGLWAQGVENFRDLFQVDFSMDKADALAYRNGAPNHAMAFVGVDVKDGKPVKWKVANSWGKKAGRKGFFTITQDWFDPHVYEVIVNKRFVPENLAAITRQKAVVMPPWDPFS